MRMKMRWKAPSQRQCYSLAGRRCMKRRWVCLCVCVGGVANNKRDKIISPNLSHSRQQDQVKLYVCNGSSLFISLPQQQQQLLETWKQTILRIRSVAHSSQSLCGKSSANETVVLVDNSMMKCYLNINILSIDKLPRRTQKPAKCWKREKHFPASNLQIWCHYFVCFFMNSACACVTCVGVSVWVCLCVCV